MTATPSIELTDFEKDYLPFKVKNWLTLHMLNVGQGDCLLLVFPESASGKRTLLVIDHYGTDDNTQNSLNYIKNYLNFHKGDDIYFIISHPHDDHIAHMIDLIREFTPKIVYISPLIRIFYKDYFKIFNAAFKLNIPVVVLRAGASMEYNGVHIACIGPTKEFESNAPELITGKEFLDSDRQTTLQAQYGEEVKRVKKYLDPLNDQTHKDAQLAMQTTFQQLKKDYKTLTQEDLQTLIPTFITQYKAFSNAISTLPKHLDIVTEGDQFPIEHRELLERFIPGDNFEKLDEELEKLKEALTQNIEKLGKIPQLLIPEEFKGREFEKAFEEFSAQYTLILRAYASFPAISKEYAKVKNTLEGFKDMTDQQFPGKIANNSSLVFKITYAGKTLLLTGDMQQEEYAQLADPPTNVDILKVPHHGGESLTNGQFKSLNPKYAAISVGYKNKHYHPNAENITVLKELVSANHQGNELEPSDINPVSAEEKRYCLYRTDDLQHFGNYNDLKRYRKPPDSGRTSFQTSIVSYVFGVIPENSGASGLVNVYRLYHHLNAAEKYEPKWKEYESWDHGNQETGKKRGLKKIKWNHRDSSPD